MSAVFGEYGAAGRPERAPGLVAHDQELVLSGAELVAEHTGRPMLCDAPHPRYRATCTLTSGHGGYHYDRALGPVWWHVTPAGVDTGDPLVSDEERENLAVPADGPVLEAGGVWSDGYPGEEQGQ